MKYYNTIIRMTEMKRLAIPRTGEDLEELELSYTLGMLNVNYFGNFDSVSKS